LHGEAFWLKLRGPDQSVISLPVIDPRLVQVWQDHPTGQRRYGFDGRDVTADIQHLELLRVPGTVHGLGPIQAARLDVAGAIDVRNYAAEWFTRGDIPNGILSTGSVLADGMAKKYKQRWEETADHGVRVLEAGLKYEPLLLKPADAQWIESQNFSTLQIARLFGVSTSLMMIAPEGGSQTYQNVEQDWIALVRFTLMKYLSEIEDALTECVPRGQKVKFNIDALLRTDTKTRYEAHQMGLAGGWLTVPEIRAMEGLPPLSQTPSTPTPKEAPHGAENPA
jgi:HK97 family phage portal protein